MRTLIVGGGSLEEGFAREYIARWKPEYVIAADRGMEYCVRLNLMPDCIIGDYDSVEPEICERLRRQDGIEWHTYPSEKDDTDSGLAMELALQKNSSAIHLLCMTGTRIDHMLGNIQLLMRPLSRKVESCILDSHNRIRLVQGETFLRRDDAFGTYVSLLPLTTMLEGVTLTGFKYPLADARMTSDNTLGISNELAADTARIFIRQGVGILIESRD